MIDAASLKSYAPTLECIPGSAVDALADRAQEWVVRESKGIALDATESDHAKHAWLIAELAQFAASQAASDVGKIRFAQFEVQIPVEAMNTLRLGAEFWMRRARRHLTNAGVVFAAGPHPGDTR